MLQRIFKDIYRVHFEGLAIHNHVDLMAKVEAFVQVSKSLTHLLVHSKYFPSGPHLRIVVHKLTNCPGDIVREVALHIVYCQSILFDTVWFWQMFLIWWQ